MAPPEKALTPNHMAQEQLPSLADIPLHHVNPRPRVAFMTAWINEPADFIGEPVLEAFEDATSTASPTSSPALHLPGISRACPTYHRLRWRVTSTAIRSPRPPSLTHPTRFTNFSRVACAD